LQAPLRTAGGYHLLLQAHLKTGGCRVQKFMPAGHTNVLSITQQSNAKHDKVLVRSGPINRSDIFSRRQAITIARSLEDGRRLPLQTPLGDGRVQSPGILADKANKHIVHPLSFSDAGNDKSDKVATLIPNHPWMLDLFCCFGPVLFQAKPEHCMSCAACTLCDCFAPPAGVF